MAKQKELKEIDLDVSDVKRIALTTDPQGETIISFEMAGGQVMNLVFSPEAFGKLEAMMSKANEAQAQVSPIQ
ncbi:hypothetical protein [Bosea robiniae]|uniref:Uncharacterized protein n=1 Tax=Bosea robiniae TaxID=1036780 RepID=A0ABY0NZ46_9HYPH|nr:hypothetical protein [Bosea robiniae]SDG44663.1 hypothetical protein SAMN05421844_10442 [Bosea robiniae]